MKTIESTSSDPSISSKAPAPNGVSSMRLGIATDHGGFELKEKLVVQLRNIGPPFCFRFRERINSVFNVCLEIAFP